MASTKVLERRWLRQLARDVVAELRTLLADPLVVLYAPNKLSADEVETNGWAVDVGRIRGLPGALAVWYDSFPKAPSRRVAACFQSTHEDDIREMVKAGTGGRAIVLTDSVWHDTPDGFSQMIRPLPARQYGHPLGEIYHRQGGWKFYTLYLPNTINPHAKPKKEVITAVARFLTSAARVGCALRHVHADEVYPKVERQKVRRHLVRERSTALAKAAKIRDDFTCRVCGFNFGEFYGNAGRGFAEAHHRVPLKSVKDRKPTKVADLVTVCANCHRMLHHMPESHLNDIAKLRRALTGWWPGRG